MRVYIILGFSILGLLLTLDFFIKFNGYTSLLDEILGNDYYAIFVIPILLIFPILGFFYLWKNDAFKKK